MIKEEIKQKAKEIFRLALELTDKEGNGLPCVSVEFNGKAAVLYVLLWENGQRMEATTCYKIYLDWRYDDEYSPNRLDEIIAEMNRLIEKRKENE